MTDPCETTDTDWRARLAELPWGSRAALDLVETLCDRAEAGTLPAEDLDAALGAFESQHWRFLASKRMTGKKKGGRKKAA